MEVILQVYLSNSFYILNTFYERSQVSYREPHWWKVKIGSGNDLVPWGIKPLHEPMFSNEFTMPQIVKGDSSNFTVSTVHADVNLSLK